MKKFKTLPVIYPEIVSTVIAKSCQHALHVQPKMEAASLSEGQRKSLESSDFFQELLVGSLANVELSRTYQSPKMRVNAPVKLAGFLDYLNEGECRGVIINSVEDASPRAMAAQAEKWRVETMHLIRTDERVEEVVFVCIEHNLPFGVSFSRAAVSEFGRGNTLGIWGEAITKYIQQTYGGNHNGYRNWLIDL